MFKNIFKKHLKHFKVNCFFSSSNSAMDVFSFGGRYVHKYVSYWKCKI